MPAKMISEEPLPIPREVICSPIHIRNRVPPVSVMTVDRMKNGTGLDGRARTLETEGDAPALHEGEHDGEVAGVLVDDLTAGLTLFLQRFEDSGLPR